MHDAEEPKKPRVITKNRVQPTKQNLKNVLVLIGWTHWMESEDSFHPFPARAHIITWHSFSVTKQSEWGEVADCDIYRSLLHRKDRVLHCGQ